MAIKEIITIPNSILKKISSSVEVVDDKIRSTLGDMLETMYAAPGIGLAAIQIGIPKRMIVMDVSLMEMRIWPTSAYLHLIRQTTARQAMRDMLVHPCFQ